MFAITQDRYGSADVLQHQEVPQPQIAKDEVLVQVRAAGLDRGTWHLMEGTPYVIRLGFGLRKPRNPIIGLDLAGTVVAVGTEVTRFAPGDEVFGIGKGSFAQYAAAKEKKLAHKPSSLTFEQAAAVPVSGLTAIQAVRDVARVTAGQRVLITGASGGVGVYATQLCKNAGAEVTGVCSTAKLGLVSELGADNVVDYTQTDFTDTDATYDVILDIGGNTRLKTLRRMLTKKGTLVIVGGEEGGPWIGGVDRQLRAGMLSPFVGQRLTSFLSKETYVDLEALTEVIEAGNLTAPVDSVFPLAQAATAMRMLADGKVKGKVCLSV
ncbi:MAG: NAD(P)-dependent alcohol dehydrogenase [Actinomycetia bacterium]|nr:NAD(P)-dependent alcohol dehydrogenase [Actinomycetes bacterium]